MYKQLEIWDLLREQERKAKRYISRYVDVTNKKAFRIITEGETPTEAHFKANLIARKRKCHCFYWVDTFLEEWMALEGQGE